MSCKQRLVAIPYRTAQYTLSPNYLRVYRGSLFARSVNVFTTSDPLTLAWPQANPALTVRSLSFLVCVSQRRSLNSIGQKKALSLSLAITLETNIIRTKRTAQSIFGQNLSSTSGQAKGTAGFCILLFNNKSCLGSRLRLKKIYS